MSPQHLCPSPFQLGRLVNHSDNFGNFLHYPWPLPYPSIGSDDTVSKYASRKTKLCPVLICTFMYSPAPTLLLNLLRIGSSVHQCLGSIAASYDTMKSVGRQLMEFTGHRSFLFFPRTAQIEMKNIKII